MRTLTAALVAELGLTVTRPAALVEFQLAGYTVRYSSIGDLTWNGVPWVGAKLELSGLTWSEAGMVTGGRVAVGNHDGAFGALVLTYDIADQPVRVWHAYAPAAGGLEAVQIFEGVADETQIGLQQVSVSLAVAGSHALYCPRETYSPATGCNFLPPPGEEIAFNGEIFRLERAEF